MRRCMKLSDFVFRRRIVKYTSVEGAVIRNLIPSTLKLGARDTAPKNITVSSATVNLKVAIKSYQFIRLQ